MTIEFFIPGIAKPGGSKNWIWNNLRTDLTDDQIALIFGRLSTVHGRSIA